MKDDSDTHPMAPSLEQLRSDLLRVVTVPRIKQRQLLNGDEARPAKRQHKAPCSDCPWARTALPGWLGGPSADEWLQYAHREDTIECHTRLKMECAGAAIYRANVVKTLRDPARFRLPPNTKLVFATPAEFKAHHETPFCGTPSEGK